MYDNARGAPQNHAEAAKALSKYNLNNTGYLL
jgi:hypothetical protein